jgi:hypothetical protein
MLNLKTTPHFSVNCTRLELKPKQLTHRYQAAIPRFRTRPRLDIPQGNTRLSRKIWELPPLDQGSFCSG